MGWLMNQSPLLIVILAGLFTWLCTTIGASFVFFFRKVNNTIFTLMIGFASGVMIAASFWSLLAPAIERAQESPIPAWIVASSGFLGGALFILLTDAVVRKTRKSTERSDKKNKCFLLIFSITLHNIPEGLAVGVAFGALIFGMNEVQLLGAISVALGIGIQNIPEGTAVAVPLRKDKMSLGKCFFYGQISGMVEPIAALLGAILVMYVQPILPFLLAFAAGAMVFVVVDELIPSEEEGNNSQRLISLGFIVGFLIMMGLDVALS